MRERDFFFACRGGFRAFVVYFLLYFLFKNFGT